MNKKMRTLLTIILFITMSFANAVDNIMPTNKTEAFSKNNGEKTIQFNFTDENLVDVINQLAAEKDANIVLPMGANAITSKCFALST